MNDSKRKIFEKNFGGPHLLHMSHNAQNGESLYLAWKLKSQDSASAHNARALLMQGEGRKLYRLRSWAITKGEAQALVTPNVSLEQITGAIWIETDKPTRTRWVSSARACATIAREIETKPVELGLAVRAEQWRFSSASGD